MAWENSDFTPANMSKTYMSRGNIYASLGDTERAKADFEMAKKMMGLF
jgi:predicted negative regulator of RcsB-dependent stress response